MTKDEMFDKIAKLIMKYEEENNEIIGADILLFEDDLIIPEGIMERQDNYTFDGEKFVFSYSKIAKTCEEE